MGLATDRISIHEVRLLLVFQKQSDRWFSSGGKP
jgi:hypothetical protein